MIEAVSLALALATAEPVPVPPIENEIEVVANKLRAWRGKWKLRDGVPACKTTRSTGDKAIDAIGCGAMVECLTPIGPQWEALNEAKLPKDELSRRANALLEEAGIGECVVAKREAGITALIAERRNRRT
ncbi:MAG: hypothetical protein ACKO1O_12965 [Erythrobacter sp.]